MAKILIVDDAAFMRKVIRDTLTKNGFTDLHEAVDGKDAVEKYFELQPDLVLLLSTIFRWKNTSMEFFPARCLPATDWRR